MGEYPIDEGMKKALDAMMAAGWVERYTSRGNASEILFTQKGAQRIDSLRTMLRELRIDNSVETVSKDLLWQVLRVAVENID